MALLGRRRLLVVVGGTGPHRAVSPAGRRCSQPTGLGSLSRLQGSWQRHWLHICGLQGWLNGCKTHISNFQGRRAGKLSTGGLLLPPNSICLLQCYHHWWLLRC